jgi:hypothetical protein
MARVVGGIFIGAFAIYLVSIGYVIYKGVLVAPEGSDSDDSDDDGSSEGHETEARHAYPPAEASPLLPNEAGGERPARGRKHTLFYHVARLILGFIALSLSGYVLSHSAASIADAFDLSGTILGVTVLSFATTLPEKFVAVISGARGHGDIVIAKRFLATHSEPPDNIFTMASIDNIDLPVYFARGLWSQIITMPQSRALA